MGELLRRIGSEELTEWQLYEEMEPFGERAEWLRYATRQATFANSLHRKSSDKVHKLADFLPETLRDVGPQKGSRAAFMDLAHALGAKVVKPDGQRI